MTHLWSQCESHFADISLGSAVKVGKILVNASAVFITAQLSVRPGLLSESLMYTPREPSPSSRQPRAFDEIWIYIFIILIQVSMSYISSL